MTICPSPTIYIISKLLVDTLELHYHKSTLLKEFKEIVKRIERIEPRGLMIRDFQSRNIMVNLMDKVFFNRLPVRNGKDL